MTKWVTKKLGEVLTIGNGQDYKHLHNGEIPVYGTGGVMTYVDDYLYDGETVCIGRKGTINKPIYFNGKIWTVDTLFYTHSFVDVLPKYVYYAFCCVDWLRFNEATGVPSLSKETIYKIEIPIPALPDGTPDLTEQRRIAGILSSADGAIAASEALIEKYRNIKRGLLTTLLQPKDGWKKVKLGECAQINRGGSPRPIDAFVTDREDGINWIKIGDIAPNGKYVNTTSEKIIPEGKQHSREVHKGDFILSNSMSFGRPYILNIDGCIHDGWLAIQDYEETFDTDFLYYMLSSDIVKKQYLAMASGSTVLNLNKEKVAKVILTIPFTSEGTPDLMEQKRIASILSSIDAKINIEEDVVEKYKGVKKGLMEEMMNTNYQCK